MRALWPHPQRSIGGVGGSSKCKTGTSSLATPSPLDLYGGPEIGQTCAQNKGALEEVTLETPVGPKQKAAAEEIGQKGQNDGVVSCEEDEDCDSQGNDGLSVPGEQN